MPDFSLPTHITRAFWFRYGGTGQSLALACARSPLSPSESPSAVRSAVYLAIFDFRNSIFGRFSQKCDKAAAEFRHNVIVQLSMSPTPSSRVTMDNMKSLFLLRHASSLTFLISNTAICARFRAGDCTQGLQKSLNQQMAALWSLRSRTSGCPPSPCRSSYQTVDPGHVIICDRLERAA